MALSELERQALYGTLLNAPTPQPAQQPLTPDLARSANVVVLGNNPAAPVNEISPAGTSSRVRVSTTGGIGELLDPRPDPIVPQLSAIGTQYSDAMPNPADVLPNVAPAPALDTSAPNLQPASRAERLLMQFGQALSDPVLIKGLGTAAQAFTGGDPRAAGTIFGQAAISSAESMLQGQLLQALNGGTPFEELDARAVAALTPQMQQDLYNRSLQIQAADRERIRLENESRATDASIEESSARTDNLEATSERTRAQIEQDDRALDLRAEELANTINETEFRQGFDQLKLDIDTRLKEAEQEINRAAVAVQRINAQANATSAQASLIGANAQALNAQTAARQQRFEEANTVYVNQVSQLQEFRELKTTLGSQVSSLTSAVAGGLSSAKRTQIQSAITQGNTARLQQLLASVDNPQASRLLQLVETQSTLDAQLSSMSTSVLQLGADLSVIGQNINAQGTANAPYRLTRSESGLLDTWPIGTYFEDAEGNLKRIARGPNGRRGVQSVNQ